MSWRTYRICPLIALAGVILALGCGGPEPTPVAAPVARRADPQPYLPPPTEGPTKSGVVLGVTAEASQDDVRSAARAFMRAWIHEDIDALMEYIGEDFSLGSSGRTLPRQVIQQAWQRQFALLDYTQFTLDEVLDPDGIEVIPYGEQRSSRHQASWLRPGDLLVRLRMRVTRRNRRRYFDDVIELWFRQVGGRWQIVALGR